MTGSPCETPRKLGSSSLRSRLYYLSHFTDEEVETQRLGQGYPAGEDRADATPFVLGWLEPQGWRGLEWRPWWGRKHLVLSQGQGAMWAWLPCQPALFWAAQLSGAGRGGKIWEIKRALIPREGITMKWSSVGPWTIIHSFVHSPGNCLLSAPLVPGNTKMSKSAWNRASHRRILPI